MDISQLCAKKIKNLREFNNYTQGYVADELEISQNAYSLLEKGTTKITIERLVVIAKLYNTTPSKLLEESNDNFAFATNNPHADLSKIHSNFPPVLSELEKLMYEQTIARLETNIEKLYDLIAQLTTKIAEPQSNKKTQSPIIMQLGKIK